MEDQFKDLFSLEGKAAIVTGGAQGLGLSICEGLAYSGASVAVVDVNGEEARKAADELCAAGHKAIALACDVSDPQQVEDTVRKAVEAFGKVDILVANAGIGDRGKAEELTLRQWERVIDINLKGVWLFDQAVGKHMISRGGGGCIINMASIAAVVGIETGNANYAAAKGGVGALTRTLAVEWSKHGIRVNSVAPAQVRTPLVNDLIKRKPETEEYFLKRIPLEGWAIRSISRDQ